MRIWSLHPSLMDAKGIVALWRETLLAKNVIEGKTKGYRNHPQLNRFKDTNNPLDAINQYLSDIYEEAEKREYNFTRDKFFIPENKILIPVNEGQVQYEYKHLLKKLEVRDRNKYTEVAALKEIKIHPLFVLRHGGKEDWEIV